MMTYPGARRTRLPPPFLPLMLHLVGRGAVDLAILVAELKRRRVFRVLVGYGIVAFAVLQIVEPILHALHLSDATLTYVVLVSIQ